MTPVDMEKEWIAVRGDDRIVGRGETKEEAAADADEPYEAVVAVPKNHSGGGPF